MTTKQRTKHQPRNGRKPLGWRQPNPLGPHLSFELGVPRLLGLPRRVWGHRGNYVPCAIAILRYLARFQEKVRSAVIHPGYDAIAKGTGYHRSHVIRTCQFLEALQILVVRTDDGHHQPNQFGHVGHSTGGQIHAYYDGRRRLVGAANVLELHAYVRGVTPDWFMHRHCPEQLPEYRKARLAELEGNPRPMMELLVDRLRQIRERVPQAGRRGRARAPS